MLIIWMFSRNEVDLNMLSFGLNAGMIQYRLDQSDFIDSGFDPIISGVNESATDFNGCRFILPLS